MATTGVDFSPFLVVTSCALFFFTFFAVWYVTGHVRKHLTSGVFNGCLVVKKSTSQCGKILISVHFNSATFLFLFCCFFTYKQPWLTALLHSYVTQSKLAKKVVCYKVLFSNSWAYGRYYVLIICYIFY